MGIKNKCFIVGFLLLVITMEQCTAFNSLSLISYSWILAIATVGTGVVAQGEQNYSENNLSQTYEIGRILGFAILGVAIIVKISIIICCYCCPGCPAYKRRQRQRQWLQSLRPVPQPTNQPNVYPFSYPNTLGPQGAYPPPYPNGVIALGADPPHCPNGVNPPPYPKTEDQQSMCPPPYSSLEEYKQGVPSIRQDPAHPYAYTGPAGQPGFL